MELQHQYTKIVTIATLSLIESDRIESVSEQLQGKGYITRPIAE